MTHSDHNGPLGAHGECWNLLPWIANESAAAKDVARVEAHLRECGECQEELEFQRQLRNAIRAEEAVVLAPQTSLHKLMQRIDTVADMDDEIEVAPAPAEPVAVGSARRAPARWKRSRRDVTASSPRLPQRLLTGKSFASSSPATSRSTT
jgi:hypothetical protein